MSVRFPTDVHIQGNLVTRGGKEPVPRSELVIDNRKVYPINPGDWRVHDSMASLLPTTSSADDLAQTGTHATDFQYLTTGDFKATTITRYARTIFTLPPEYVSASPLRLVASAGMQTTVADVSCTVDFSLHEWDREGVVGSDLVTTSETDINSLTFADKEFAVTSTTLAAGDTLDIRNAIAGEDTATGTAVIASLGAVEIYLNVRG